MLLLIWSYFMLPNDLLEHPLSFCLDLHACHLTDTLNTNTFPLPPSVSHSLTHTHYPPKYHNILDNHPPRWVMGRRDCSEGRNPCQKEYSARKIDSTKIRKFSAVSMLMSFFSMKVQIPLLHSLCNSSLNCCWSLIEHFSMKYHSG